MAKKTSTKVDRTPDRKGDRKVLDATRSIDSLGPLSTTVEHREAAACIVVQWIKTNVDRNEWRAALDDVAGALGVMEFVRVIEGP